VYPWIYTGGIDPYLWRPIPGVQTLNFAPYRVDLTPFAGVLSNGQQHTVSVNVFNANNYFSETATLLLYLDAGSTQVTGAVTKNTIGQPAPVVTEHLKTTNTGVTGTITDVSNRGFTLEGYAMTSYGKVTTQVTQSVDFFNKQKYYVSNTAATFTDNQTVDQTTRISSVTKTNRGGNWVIDAKQLAWPLKLAVQFSQSNVDGSYQQSTKINQELDHGELVLLNGVPVSFAAFSDAVAPTDTLAVDAQGHVTTTGQANSEKYSYFDSTGSCWNETIAAAAGVLTKVQGGKCDRR
jgi:hypothetical protein